MLGDFSKPIKVELYRNRREFLYNIPLEWIGKMEYRFNNITKFELKVPKFIGIEGKINPIYLKILSRQQLVIDDKERYILMERKGNNTKRDGYKVFTAYSFEKTLEKKRIEIPSSNYQLISDDIHVAQGILELALKDTEWNIGHVDNECRVVNQLAPVVDTVNIATNYTKANVQYDELLWSKDFDINVGQNNPLYMSVNYSGIEANKEGIKYGFVNTENIFDPLYTGIKHIDCYYVNEIGNRFGTKYIITLQDNVIETVSHTFNNVTGKDLSIDKIDLKWETGEYVKQDMVIYPQFDSIDDNILNVLNDIQTTFDCTMIYDTMSKTVNVYAKQNIGNAKQPILSLKSNVLQINDTEDVEIPTGLKVVGKDGLSISSENIYGGDIIYNYAYYINNKILSDSCINDLERFEALATLQRDKWDLIRSQTTLMSSKKIKIESEITSLNNRIKYYKELVATLAANGDKEGQKKTQEEIDILELRLAQCLRDLDETNTKLQELSDETLEISNNLNRRTAKDDKGIIFTNEDLQELDDIDEIVTAEDDYYSNASLLYNFYVKEMNDKVNIKVDWTMDTERMIKCFSEWKRNVYLGDLFYCGADVEEIIHQDTIRFIGYDYIPSEEIPNKFYFSNKEQLTDKLKNGFGGNARKTNKTYQKSNSYEQVWEDSMLSNNFVSTLREQGLNLSATQIRGLTSSNILDFGSYGMFIKDAENMNNQLYIGSGLIGLSTDGFKTCETAIDANGVVANKIIGDLILGEKLCITSNDSLFYIGIIDANKQSFGIKISEGTATTNIERIFLGLETDNNGVKRAKLRLVGKDGEVNFDENGYVVPSTESFADNVSPNYPIEAYIWIPDGVTRIKESTLKVRLGQYRGYTKSVTTTTTTKTTASSSKTSSGASSASTTEDVSPHAHILMKGTKNPTDPEGEIYNCSYKLNLNDTIERGILQTKIYTKSGGIPPSLDIYTYQAGGSHSHNMPHTHNIEHFHNIFIDLNTTVNTGISLYEKASNVRVEINGQTVRQNISANIDIDISAYLVRNYDNVVRIYSSTNGRLSGGVFTKYYIRW